MSDISKLLSDVKLLLSFDDKKPDYVQPKRAFVYYEFLAPVRLSDSDFQKLHLIHVFPPQTTTRKMHPLDTKDDIILHGHTEDQLCAAPYFCHCETFVPEIGSHNPLFIKNFNLHWGLNK